VFSVTALNFHAILGVYFSFISRWSTDLLATRKRSFNKSPAQRTRLHTECQWRNDGLAAASRDGGPPLARGPRQFQVLND